MDARLGRRVARGVVQQLGERVDERLHRRTDHGHVGDRVQLDPLVVQDPRHGAAQHAVERDGLAPLAPGAGATEDGDAVGEAADQGRAVVEPEQVGEELGPLAVPVLHAPQVGGLLVDDRLHPAGDVDHTALRRVPHALLGPHRVDDRAQQRLVRGLELRAEALALRPHGHQYVLGELALLEPGHRLGKPLLGELYRAGLLEVEPVLERGHALLVGGAQRLQRPSAPGHLGGEQSQGDRGDAAAQRDSDARLLGYQHRGDRGRHGRDDGGHRPRRDGARRYTSG